jgi:hypothetical protein
MASRGVELVSALRDDSMGSASRGEQDVLSSPGYTTLGCPGGRYLVLDCGSPHLLGDLCVRGRWRHPSDVEQDVI